MPTISLVSKPSVSASCAPLQVRQQEVIAAYFAKRIMVDEASGKKVKFEEIKNAKIGEEVYIVIETKHLQGEELVIRILQDEDGVLVPENEPITVQVDGKEETEIKATVGGYCHEEDYTNAADFEDWAIVKIILQPKEEPTQKDWVECIITSTNKKANLYLEVDAYTNHSLPNFDVAYPLYQGCKAESNTSNLCNNFLYGDDAWLGLEVFELAPWMEIAIKELGVDENTTAGFKRVKEYYKDGAGQRSLHPEKNAWCSSFANWVLVETNKIKGTEYSFIPRNGHTNNPALAINFANQRRYPGGVIVSPNKKPPFGSIMIINKVGHSDGHASFVINYIPTTNGFIIVGLGGNQSDTVRENEYEFKKVNNKFIYTSKYGTKFKLLGFVLPEEYDYDEQDEIYYKYNNVRAPKAGSTR